MSLDQAIRGALQTVAVAIPGFPSASQISVENRKFSSTPGTPWARLRLAPASSRPNSVNVATKRHDGFFLIDLFEPPNIGTGAIEALGNAVRDALPAGRRLSLSTGDVVAIDYVERTGPLEQQSDWLQCSVTVKWHCFSRAN